LLVLKETSVQMVMAQNEEPKLFVISGIIEGDSTRRNISVKKSTDAALPITSDTMTRVSDSTRVTFFGDSTGFASFTE